MKIGSTERQERKELRKAARSPWNNPDKTEWWPGSRWQQRIRSEGQVKMIFRWTAKHVSISSFSLIITKRSPDSLLIPRWLGKFRMGSPCLQCSLSFLSLFPTNCSRTGVQNTLPSLHHLLPVGLFPEHRPAPKPSSLCAYACPRPHALPQLHLGSPML